MVFTRSSLSFFVFSGIFVAVSAATSVFIVPLLFLSFTFAGFVVIFNGLSYVSFKLASSKYNHTVLLLNKLLRKLADNIPPSVGFEEIKSSRLSSFSTFPSLEIRARATLVLAYLSSVFSGKTKLSSEEPNHEILVEHKTEVALSRISDEDDSNNLVDIYLENRVAEPEVQDPLEVLEARIISGDEDPVKASGEITTT